jgi:hypothetical protein
MEWLLSDLGDRSDLDGALLRLEHALQAYERNLKTRIEPPHTSGPGSLPGVHGSVPVNGNAEEKTPGHSNAEKPFGGTIRGPEESSGWLRSILRHSWSLMRSIVRR